MHPINTLFVCSISIYAIPCALRTTKNVTRHTNKHQKQTKPNINTKKSIKLRFVEIWTNYALRAPNTSLINYIHRFNRQWRAEKKKLENYKIIYLSMSVIIICITDTTCCGHPPHMAWHVRNIQWAIKLVIYSGRICLSYRDRSPRMYINMP